ncbi:MAG: helix-turn-helix domain-containing protein [Gemmatimonadales bacterium]|nr:helix-turn-helix domain-containing protein [Gemmatimonadales bacterium]NIQ98644.1 helix-turn-helix domain-containing protein [Gemmatimonadales bacterium]
MEHHKLLRVSEVAAILDVPTARAYSLTRSGTIPAVRLGRQVRVHPEVLDQWIRNGGQALCEHAKGPQPAA